MKVAEGAECGGVVWAKLIELGAMKQRSAGVCANEAGSVQR